MTALLFGSISSVADSSELQREAFNEAFAEHGLDWNWDRDDYRSRLGKAGGEARIADEATARGEDVDAAAVHATKSRIFQEKLRTQAPAPRPGVLDALRAAKSQGWKTGFVTTTSRDNVLALLDGLQAIDPSRGLRRRRRLRPGRHPQARPRRLRPRADDPR